MDVVLPHKGVRRLVSCNSPECLREEFTFRRKDIIIQRYCGLNNLSLNKVAGPTIELKPLCKRYVITSKDSLYKECWYETEGGGGPV